MNSQRVARDDEIAEGRSLRFGFRQEGISRNGFVSRFRGRLVAYENVCRHLPLPLDDDDNRFFTRDGLHFVCQNHGAMFDPSSGVCVRGPCEGVRLFSLAVDVKNGEVWVETPELRSSF